MGSLKEPNFQKAFKSLALQKVASLHMSLVAHVFSCSSNYSPDVCAFWVWVFLFVLLFQACKDVLGWPVWFWRGECFVGFLVFCYVKTLGIEVWIKFKEGYGCNLPLRSIAFQFLECFGSCVLWANTSSRCHAKSGEPFQFMQFCLLIHSHQGFHVVLRLFSQTSLKLLYPVYIACLHQ